MWTMVLVKMLGFFFLISLEFTGEKIVCKNVPNFHFFPFPSFLALNPTEMYVCNFKKNYLLILRTQCQILSGAAQNRSLK